MRVWRDRLLVEAMFLSYIVAGVLIVADLYAPEYRLRGLGVVALIVATLLTVIWKIDSCIGRVWDARGRAERRRAELEAASQPQQGLSVVRGVSPR